MAHFSPVSPTTFQTEYMQPRLETHHFHRTKQWTAQLICQETNNYIAPSREHSALMVICNMYLFVAQLLRNIADAQRIYGEHQNFQIGQIFMHLQATAFPDRHVSQNMRQKQVVILAPARTKTNPLH